MNNRFRPYDIVKRGLDVLGAAVALVLLSPVLLVTAVVVAARLGRPVIFAQPRPGRHGRVFTLYKFRSMRPVDEARGWVTNEQRMTRFGRALRATSIDELPSLWNILVGDLSFVGPRPLRISYLDRYSDEQQRRHAVRPGLTGLAQVSGRNAIGWDDRLRRDQEYVARRSIVLDVRVLLLTAKAVLEPRGISAEGQATMSEFFGPESTSRMRLVPLAQEHLETRVAWLSDERVRQGVSLAFTPEIEAMTSWFTEASASPDRWDWVGVDPNGSLVSMCGLHRTEDGAASLYIYVAPDHHGKGLGRDTMILLQAQARRLGFARLDLETPAANEPARRLYERLGFVRSEVPVEGHKIALTKDIRTGHGNG